MWLYQSQEFNLNEHSEAFAFVYIITNLKNSKQYVGQKQFFTFKYRSVNKKRKKVKVESDWKEYFGSSNDLLEDVKALGEDNFKREIIHLCPRKGIANYLEAKEQMMRGVLESDNYYNGIINCRVSKSHLKNQKL